MLKNIQKVKQYTENIKAKLRNSNQNSTFSWVSLIGSEQPGPVAALLGWPKSMYYFSFNGPLKYLVAKLHGCYRSAVSLPVSQMFFARFFRHRARLKSPVTFVYFVATNTRKTFRLHFY